MTSRPLRTLGATKGESGSSSRGPAKRRGRLPGVLGEEGKEMGRLRSRIRRFLMGMEGAQALVAAAPPVPIREIFRRFWPYARPYRRWLWLILLFIALVPAIDTAMIWMFKLVVDEVLVPLDFGPLLWLVLAYLGLTLLN